MIKKGSIFLMVSTFVILGVYLYLHRDRSRSFTETEAVYIKTVDGKPQLFKDGKPFYIKGASGSSHLRELSEAGGNTLRVYDTINLAALLDEASKYKIAVIVDIYLPAYDENSDYYTTSSNTEPLKRTIRKLVHRHKNHPALLIWNLGNEVNYPLTFTENGFIKTFNEIINLIHNEDPDHLISTTVSGIARSQTLGLLLNSPKLDLIGFNAFGSLSKLGSVLNELSFFTTIKPYYITEWGIHGPWEAPFNLWWSAIETNSGEKGMSYREIYGEIIQTDKKSLGSLVFYWGYKHEGTTTWFNIFDDEGRKSEAYYDLKSVWTGEKKTAVVPKIDVLTLNDTISQNLIILPDSHLDAELILQEPIDSLSTFQWHLYKEAWGNQKWVKVPEVKVVFQSSNSNSSSRVRFNVPHIEGPYRLFVSVFDGNGNFATTNSPFYILARE